MALWDDLLVEIYAITSRPDLVTETAMSLRKATRNVHASGRFWRDAIAVPLSGVVVAQVQDVNLELYAPRFRKVISLTAGSNVDHFLTPVNIDELLDNDNYARTNIFWGLGTSLRIRAASPNTDYILTYLRYPEVFPAAAYATWIANEFRDLLVLKAAIAVLNLSGEQEMIPRFSEMVNEMQRELVQANIEIIAR